MIILLLMPLAAQADVRKDIQLECEQSGRSAAYCSCAIAAPYDDYTLEIVDSAKSERADIEHRMRQLEKSADRRLTLPVERFAVLCEVYDLYTDKIEESEAVMVKLAEDGDDERKSQLGLQRRNDINTRQNEFRSFLIKEYTAIEPERGESYAVTSMRSYTKYCQFRRDVRVRDQLLSEAAQGIYKSFRLGGLIIHANKSCQN